MLVSTCAMEVQTLNKAQWVDAEALSTPTTCQRWQVYKWDIKRKSRRLRHLADSEIGNTMICVLNGRKQPAAALHCKGSTWNTIDWKKFNIKKITWKSRIFCLTKNHSHTLWRRFGILYHSTEAGYVLSDDN